MPLEFVEPSACREQIAWDAQNMRPSWCPAALPGAARRGREGHRLASKARARCAVPRVVPRRKDAEELAASTMLAKVAGNSG